jgi:hypothetical protein
MDIAINAINLAIKSSIALYSNEIKLPIGNR